MADDLMSRIGAFGVEYLTQRGRCDFDEELLPEVYARFGDEIRDRWESMSRESVRRFLKAQMSRLEDDDSTAVIQTALPGFDLPKAISVPGEGGRITWVHTPAATREDAFAQRQLRETNIINAVRKRDVWDRTLDRLRPAWAINPDWTIGECIDHLAAQP